MATTERLAVQGAELVVEHELDGQGVPLLLVHAGIADRTMWDGVVGRLEGRPWIRYDLRGFGDSALPDGAYVGYLDLLGVLDALGVERAAVCGISFGGGLSIDAAIAAPDRVAALVAVDTSPFGRERDPGLTAQMQEADAMGEAGDIDGAVELELRIWVDGPQRGPDELDPALRERARAMNRRAWDAGMGGDVDVLEPYAAGRLAEITAPTLVIVGALDQPSTHESCRQLAEEIPNARLAVMPGAAHLPPLEQPEAFARLVVDFLRDAGV
jgi:3-oxoadipate enol-lactonase